MSEGKPPVIKKIIKQGHGGHYGGSWKVAYADFVTAMMAFFLVMWLLAMASQQGRAALADYYNTLTLTEAIFNGGRPNDFDGKGPSVLDGGCFSPRPEATETEEKPESGGLVEPPPDPDDLASLPPGLEGGEGGEQAGIQPYEGQEGAGPGPYQPTPAEVAKSRLSQELLQAAAGELADISDSMRVEITPEGLRVQVVDKEGRPMFNTGGANPSPEARRILKVIGNRLARVPNKIAIEGHTDSTGFKNSRYSNWELSTGRAATARMLLEENGLPQDRLVMVAGMAATQPLDRENPADPINRRISIMIYDQPEEVAAQERPRNHRPAGPPSLKRFNEVWPETSKKPPETPAGGRRSSWPPAQPTLEELESTILEDNLSGPGRRP